MNCRKQDVKSDFVKCWKKEPSTRRSFCLITRSNCSSGNDCPVIAFCGDERIKPQSIHQNQKLNGATTTIRPQPKPLLANQISRPKTRTVSRFLIAWLPSLGQITLGKSLCLQAWFHCCNTRDTLFCFIVYSFGNFVAEQKQHCCINFRNQPLSKCTQTIPNLANKTRKWILLQVRRHRIRLGRQRHEDTFGLES